MSGVWNDAWCMVYDAWCVVYGVWCMVYGCTVYGVRCRVQGVGRGPAPWWRHSRQRPLPCRCQ
eukprot:533639-Rhodomonas_salina.1